MTRDDEGMTRDDWDDLGLLGMTRDEEGMNRDDWDDLG